MNKYYHQFVTDVKDLDVWKFREFLLGETTIADIEIEPIVCKVFWDAYINITDYSINNIDIIPTKIECEFDWNYWDDELTHEETDILLAKGGVKDGNKIVGNYKFSMDDWTIDSDLEIKESYCCPENVELDFAKKIITIS